jgi:predicted Zn-dependent protease
MAGTGKTMGRAIAAARLARHRQLVKPGLMMSGVFNRRRRAALAALFFAAECLSTAALADDSLPDLGDAAQAMVTPQDERRLGEQSMGQVRSAGGYLDDPEVNAYLNALGQRLLAGLTTSQPDFSFFAVPSSEINAFALPGGFIGVNTGLILAARSESELASVLAHEITHVTQHHMARQTVASAHTQTMAMAALLTALVADHSGNGQIASAAMSATMAAQAQSQINYTRAHEHEADRLGFALLAQAGFDTHGMAGFFERLQQVVRGQEGTTPSYLRSHPLTHERVADAQNRAADTAYRQVADSPDFHFVRALLRSYDGRPEEAVTDFTSRLAEKTLSKP